MLRTQRSDLEILEMLVNLANLFLDLSVSGGRLRPLTATTLASEGCRLPFPSQVFSVQLIAVVAGACCAQCSWATRRAFVPMSVQLPSHFFVFDHNDHPHSHPFVAPEHWRTVYPTWLSF